MPRRDAGVPRPATRVTVERRLVDFPPPTPQPTPCRLWQGPEGGNGYGVRPDGKGIHVWVWEQINGPVPKGLEVCHHCDNRFCFRYDHLFLGTRGDNARDAAAKGRIKPPTGEQHYAARLTEQQVIEIRSRRGETRKVLAAAYGVSEQTVGDVLLGRTWKHLLP